MKVVNLNKPRNPTDRVKFEIGYQTTLIQLLKQQTCLTWKDIAACMGVCKHTIRRDWKNERCLSPLLGSEKNFQIAGA